LQKKVLPQWSKDQNGHKTHSKLCGLVWVKNADGIQDKQVLDHHSNNIGNFTGLSDASIGSFTQHQPG